MKRIFTISTLAIAACVGFNSVANALPVATSTHTGTVTKTCAVGAVDGIMQPKTNTITGDGGFTGNFPKIISSATSDGGTPGKFVTLCNTDPSRISIELGGAGVTVPTGQIGHTTTFTLSSPSVSPAVYKPIFLKTYEDSEVATSNAVNHAYKDTPTDLNISAQIESATGKVLVGATTNYSVPLRATLTP